MQMNQKYDTGKKTSNVNWKGVVALSERDLNRVMKRPGEFIDGWGVEESAGSLILLPKPNLVVNVGVQRSLDRLFAINSTPAALTRIGVDNGTTNPVAASLSSDAGSGADTGSSTQTLRTFDSTPTRTNQVVTASGTFNDPTTGGIGAVSYAMKRLFLSAHTANITNTTSADASDSLYSMTNVFTVDFTGIATWSAVFAATVTGIGA